MIEVCQTTCRFFLYSDGRVAQLGERIHGMDEAAGSIPVTSTKIPNQFQSRLATEMVLLAGYTHPLFLSFRAKRGISPSFRMLKPKRDSSLRSKWQNGLFQNLGRKAGEGIVHDAVGNLNRIAADFAILDVFLPANRKVQHH
jgi:hypothetical protein